MTATKPRVEATKPSTPPSRFEARDVDDAVFTRALHDVHESFVAHDVAYGLCGGIASAILGRPRHTRDIDVMIRPTDRALALDALEDAGFETHQTNPHWLYKGTRDGVLVDVLFRAKGEIYMDDEMTARCTPADFRGVRVYTIPPEDLVVIKAIIFDEETPRHWYDALGVLVSRPIDWDYLRRRSLGGGPRRMLSLLAFAQSCDIAVPDAVIARLASMLYEM